MHKRIQTYEQTVRDAIEYSNSLAGCSSQNKVRLRTVSTLTTLAVCAVAAWALVLSIIAIIDGVREDSLSIRTSEYKAIQIASIAGLTISKYDVDIIVRTVIGEASREPDVGKIAVVWVILNRALRNKSWYGGSNVADVSMKKSTRMLSGNRRITTWQFEPWMHSHTRAYLWSISEESALYQHVHSLVLGCLGGLHADPTDGATHFLNPTILRARGVPIPQWARGEGRRIGNHVFFR